MRKTAVLLLILSISAVLIISSCDRSPTDPDNNDIDEELRFKIAQMLIIGFRGIEISDTNHIVDDITQSHIGGVILYEYDSPSASRPRNIQSPAQLSALVNDLQVLDTIPLLVCIDQEGGFVNRLRESYGFPPHVSAQHIGEVDDEDTTRYWANSCAMTLEEMGININFAPVVDLNINPDCPAIGRWERSYSADPEKVTFHASIVIEEHNNRGVFTALKHFPGHGSSEHDTHWGMADVTETWLPSELDPYSRLIDDGYDGLIMTAHISHTELDPLFPATLSHAIMTGILRDSLGFDGIIVSDDMMMGAIEEFFGLEEALELAINAGVDLLIFSNNSSVYNANIASVAINTIENLVEEGRIPRTRIEEAYSRISSLKARL